MESPDDESVRAEKVGWGRKQRPTVKPDTDGKAGKPRQLAHQSGVIVPLRVVVVDDNRDAADSLTLLLRAWGHDVTTVYDGRHGLDLILRTRPDAALLDIGLPSLSGYQIAEELVKSDAVPTVLAAISGYGHPADVTRAKAAGFHFHFLKPAQPEDVAKVVETARRAAP